MSEKYSVDVPLLRCVFKQSGVTINIEDFMYTEGDSGNRPTLVQKVLPNTQYNISYQEKIGAINLDINQYSDLPKYAREEESTFIKSIYYAGSLRNITITTESNCKYIGISFYTSTDAIQGFKGLQVEKNNSMSSHTVPQSNKTTILLPCQLQKVGNVYDRLYWDSEKGRYVVEKVFNKYIMKGTEHFTVYEDDINTDYCRAFFDVSKFNMKNGNTSKEFVIANGFMPKSFSNQKGGVYSSCTLL